MSQNSSLFYRFFSIVFFADSSRNNGFKLAESPFFLLDSAKKENRLKRTSKMNCYFGTCKPAMGGIQKPRSRSSSDHGSIDP